MAYSAVSSGEVNVGHVGSGVHFVHSSSNGKPTPADVELRCDPPALAPGPLRPVPAYSDLRSSSTGQTSMCTWSGVGRRRRSGVASTIRVGGNAGSASSSASGSFRAREPSCLKAPQEPIPTASEPTVLEAVGAGLPTSSDPNQPHGTRGHAQAIAAVPDGTGFRSRVGPS